MGTSTPFAGQAQPFDLQIRCVQADGFQIRAADSIQSVLIEQDLDSGPGKGGCFARAEGVESILL
jgi:hypothetical protein